MQNWLNALTFEEDGWQVAQCIEIDVASQGNTQEEAVENLKEAIKLHLTPPVSSIVGAFAVSVAEARRLLPNNAVLCSWELSHG